MDNSFGIEITPIRTATVNFALGYTGENYFTRGKKKKNTPPTHPVQLNCCAKNFPNNGDDFGLASDEVPEGYQEQKAIHFYLM